MPCVRVTDFMAPVVYGHIDFLTPTTMEQLSVALPPNPHPNLLSSPMYREAIYAQVSSDRVDTLAQEYLTYMDPDLPLLDTTAAHGDDELSRRSPQPLYALNPPSRFRMDDPRNHS